MPEFLEVTCSLKSISKNSLFYTKPLIMGTFRDLIVYKKAVALSMEIISAFVYD
jgi:hypothetical protein